MSKAVDAPIRSVAPRNLKSQESGANQGPWLPVEGNAVSFSFIAHLQAQVKSCCILAKAASKSLLKFISLISEICLFMLIAAQQTLRSPFSYS